MHIGGDITVIQVKNGVLKTLFVKSCEQDCTGPVMAQIIYDDADQAGKDQFDAILALASGQVNDKGTLTITDVVGRVGTIKIWAPLEGGQSDTDITEASLSAGDQTTVNDIINL